jgi:hypothetical protein
MEPLSSLNIELAGKDFERTLIPEGQCLLQVLSGALEPNKAGDNYNLVVKYTNANPTPSNKDGVILEAGAFTTTTWDGVLQTENQKAKGVDPIEGICRTIDAIFGCEPDARPNLNADTVAAMAGQQVIGYIKHEDDPVYGKQARVVRVVKAE